jgi:ABC-type lipoprotein release transport system permease subunit
VLLGMLINVYFSTYGFYIGNYGVTGMLIGDTIYSRLTATDTINLTIVTYVITLLASLYPAILASRLEPVEALHAQ